MTRETDSAVVEVLFPEIANLYGDHANIRYLKECMPELCCVEDALSEEPYFAGHTPDMIYMGPMTEHQQELVIAKLRPYKERLEELIAHGVLFLVTGNAMEVFWDAIENEDGSRIEGLGIFHYTAKRDMFHRYNRAVMGQFEGMTLVGFKSQFTHSYGDNSKEFFFEAAKGDGINRQSRLEGVRRNRFFGTYALGPIMILNPDFALYIQKELGAERPALAYEKAVREAYEERLRQYADAEFVLL